MTDEICNPLPLAKDDDWRQVKDPKKRKQIQDRLAQRARRKRLAQQQVGHSEDLIQITTQHAPFEGPSSASVCKVRYHGKTVVTFGAFTSVPIILPGTEMIEVVVPKIMDEAHLPISCHSAYAALFDNGQLLGLSCSTVNRSRSQYDCSNLPQYLHPSELQKKIVHAEWIDRFPFPYMRDACISLLDRSSEEEFIADLFKMSSFAVLQGSASWDPAGWVITTTFKEKWGHLFFPDLSNSTDLT